ncbi:MAG TPA: response regulator [Flavobacteriia bacterium]|nr:response regulator [Flavobacteriia bacterium]
MINIIILDDELESNPDNIELWESDLEKINSDFKLEIYSSPKNALESIEHLGHNTIVILDMQMPEMNGAEFLNELRNKNITIPVIGYTGNPNDNLLIELLKNDLFSYVRKANNNPNELVEYINKAIEKFKDNIPLELTDALEEYLNRRPERKEKKIHTKDGRIIQFGDILEEMNNNTEMGVDYQKALYKMSFEALLDGEKQL